MKTVIQRVAKWNAARYEQVMDIKLAESLLREELSEWHAAYMDAQSEVLTAEVEMLDALADITYVAFGIAWKADCELEEAWERNFAETINAVSSWPQQRPAFFIAGLIDSFVQDFEIGVADGLVQIVAVCFAEAMYTLRLTQDQFKAALLAVCDSNDTKSIHKVASDVKANAGNKGPYYVSPTAALEKILKERPDVE